VAEKVKIRHGLLISYSQPKILSRIVNTVRQNVVKEVVAATSNDGFLVCACSCKPNIDRAIDDGRRTSKRRMHATSQQLKGLFTTLEMNLTERVLNTCIPN